MMANRMKSVFLAAALVSLAAPVALAGDFRLEQRHPKSAYLGLDRGNHHHGRRGELKWRAEKTLGGASRAVGRNRQAETDSGSITTLATSGIAIGSTLFYSDGTRLVYLDQQVPNRKRDGLTYPAPKAKIIDVTQEIVNGSFRPVNGCVYEHGVCVIRGRN